MPAALRIEREGLAALSGEMVFETVPSLLNQGAALFASAGGDVVLDLTQVTQTDSAGLALLLEWIDQARQHGRSLRFLNLPAALLGIAHLSNAEGLLPIAQSAEG